MIARSRFGWNRILFGLTGMLVAVLLLAACQPSAPGAAPTDAALPETGATAAPIETTAPEPTEAPVEATATTAATEAPVMEEAEINVATDAALGEILVGNNGMTLYMFTKDEPNKSNCADTCLDNWPPLLTQGSPKLGEGVDPALVGSAEMPDGTMIVTYNEMPLYFWAKDTKPGDTTGQGVGEVWYVVSPTGEAVGLPAAEAEVNVATDPALGEILVGNDGMTLYMFTKDEPNKSNCADTCLDNWPPLITQGSPKLGEGVDPDLVGSAEMPDGSMIVTYNEMPLYYWAKDTKAGDTTGQGVGEVWYVVAPDGNAVGLTEDSAEISVANDPVLGEILVGSDGMTLYIFTNDEPNKSSCAGNCLVNWPPLLTEGNPKLGEGVDPALVGTADLADGSKIVTYNGMPLYYWKDDTQAGDTTGQGVGDVWYVISPAGEIIGQ